MATPKDPLWERKPHTAAKHDLLRRYLQAWAPILLTKFPRVTYAEGFAGPGEYWGGEPGSPVIALNVFLGFRQHIDAGTHLAMVLLDEDQRRVAHLRGQLDRTLSAHGQPKPSNLCIVAEPGRCGERLEQELAKTGAFGKPILAILDSWGGPDVPFSLLKRIAQNRNSEVLVTFGPTFLTRFGEQSQHRQSGDEAFGGAGWQGVFEQPPHLKKKFLVDCYRESLRKAGFAYSLSFELIDDTGFALFLTFGTNSPRGLEKMKESLWKVDPIAGLQFRDPRGGQDQMLLDLEPDRGKSFLGRLLVERLGDEQMCINDLRDYALFETVYRPEHVISAVRSLVTEGTLETVPFGKRVTRDTVVRRSRRRQDAPATLF